MQEGEHEVLSAALEAADDLLRRAPHSAELEQLASQHPPPPPMGEVAVDDRSVEQLLIALAHLTRRSNQISGEIAMETQKAEQWKIENRRRKHNYVPFIVNLLKQLAERGELMPLLEAAKSRKKAKTGGS